jgi:hypothetical protein
MENKTYSVFVGFSTKFGAMAYIDSMKPILAKYPEFIKAVNYHGKDPETGWLEVEIECVDVDFFKGVYNRLSNIALHQSHKIKIIDYTKIEGWNDQNQ